MLIEIKCLCGHRQQVEEPDTDQRIPCQGCWRTIFVAGKDFHERNRAETPEPERPVAPAPPVVSSRVAELIAAAAKPPAAAPPGTVTARCLCGSVNQGGVELAGQTVKCQDCWRMVIFPAAPTELKLQTSDPAQMIQVRCGCGKKMRVGRGMIGEEIQCTSCLSMFVAKEPPRDEDARGILAPPPQRTYRDYLYWALLIFLVPLFYFAGKTDHDDFVKRLDQALTRNPDVRARLVEKYKERIRQAFGYGFGPGTFQDVNEGGDFGLPISDNPTVQELLQWVSLDEVILALPGQKVDEHAYLPRSAMNHWYYAGAAMLVFFTLCALLFAPNPSQAKDLLLVGLFTGTIGVGWLLAVHEVFGFGLIEFLLLYGDRDFGKTMIFYILFVGLFEELFKALPLFWHYRVRGPLGWRGGCLWGLASGAGFGISEGIMYSDVFYNGITGFDAYLIRFASCVALHAVWTASVGITMARLHKYFKTASLEENLDHMARRAADGAYLHPAFFIEVGAFQMFFKWVMGSMPFVAIVMTLHGLYDTFLVQEMEYWALATALLSFGWLGWQIETRREEEKEAESRAAPAAA